MDANILGVGLGFISAAIWGAGDFGGGLSARRISPFQTMVLLTSSGVVTLAIITLLRGETLPAGADLAWTLAAGSTGAFAMAALYRGLATGNSARVAPTAALLGTAFPVIFGTLLDGFPGVTRLAGFIVGAMGVWMVSRTNSKEQDTANSSMLMAILAGFGFAAFFILISRVQSTAVFSVLLTSKLAALAVSLIMLRIRSEVIPPLKQNWIALLAGILDAGGNVFYLFAQQVTRMDVAVVLSSMYPAATVLLSRWFLQERTARGQWLGILLCLTAIALIAI